MVNYKKRGGVILKSFLSLSLTLLVCSVCLASKFELLNTNNNDQLFIQANMRHWTQQNTDKQEEKNNVYNPPTCNNNELMLRWDITVR